MHVIIQKSLVVLIAAVMIATGFGITLDQASAATGPTSITVKAASGTGTSAVVDIKGKVKVYVSSVLPSTASKSVTWSIISGSSYGKISSSSSTYCYLQGIKTGTVTLKAKSKYYPYNYRIIKVYVKQLYPTGVTISKSSLRVYAGRSYPLTATVVKKPWVYSAGVTWSTSNSSAATVDTAGKVAGIKSGSATITATSKDKSTLKATCLTRVYSLAMDTPGRINLTLGDADFPNPMVVTGPGATLPTHTITYTSSNHAAVTVGTTGTLHIVGEGSSTITATIKMDSITSTTKTKTLTYPVNVKQAQDTDFQFNKTSAYLEVTQNTTGYLKGSTLLFNSSQLDDLFGYGTLGMNIWDPLDMYFNFQATDISWHAGDFAFDKVNQTNADLADAEILPDKNASIPTYVPYWLDDIAVDNNCVNLITDSEDVITGYEILFYYDKALNPATTNSITLNGNALTLQFETSELKLVHSQANQVQAFATADADGTLNDLVLTITRDLTYYHVVVNDADYIAKWGIEFNIYSTYK